MNPRFHHRTIRLIAKLTLLALLFWTAPLPQGHTHKSCQSYWTSNQLSEHLQSCHDGIGDNENLTNGWHWHWVFRANSLDGIGDADDADLSRSAITCPDHAVADQEIPSPLYAWVWKATLVTPTVSIDRGNSFNTAALLASRQSLPELLGIIRC